jgi:predicted  nucleic acid-binding Zn-ribbon protein
MLSGKLKNLNERTEEEKLNNRMAYFQKIKSLQEKVGQKSAAQDIQFKILKEHIDRLNEDIEEERRIREDFEQELDSNIYPVS